MLNLKYHFLLISILPFVAIHLSLFLSFQDGFLISCNPYIEGCYSISKVARQPSSIIIFKVTLSISAFLLFFIWEKIFKNDLYKNHIFLGKLGSISLIIYILALGNDGLLYEFMRKFGVFIFYMNTLYLQWIYTFAQTKLLVLSTYRVFFLKILAYLQIMIFIFSLPFFLIIKNDGYIENIIEWWVSLTITIWFFINFIYYKKYDQ
tara:strand:- start:50 stop:667 length:618 start_codon:yes stop_codon:yes gene_type:complete